MKYPYHEDSAGIFRSRSKTGDTSEALLASNDILSLAKEILIEGIYLEAEKLATMLVGPPSQKKSARATLQAVLLPPPKRPIYYLAHELEFLPRWTREALRILADWLYRYNKFLYRDAKHDFKLPHGRKEHRFTSREVVLCLFITKELSNRLTKLSDTALRVSRDESM